MRLGSVAILLAAVVIASLNAILLLGAAGHDLDAPPRVLDGFILALDVSLVASSLLLGIGFARRGQGFLSALFLGNMAIFLIAGVLRASGVVLRPAILFAVDLYWLQLYLIVLARHWRKIVGKDA